MSEGLFDARAIQLQAWAAGQLDVPVSDTRLTVASADASFRRYFRMHLGEQSWIAMDSPPAQEPLGSFLHLARWLDAQALPAPRVQAADPEAGFALLTDLGRHTLLDVLTPDNADRLYQAALSWLAALQIAGRRSPPAPAVPDYDRGRLMDEMALFPEWYLGRHTLLDVLTPDNADRLYQAALSWLAALQIAGRRSPPAPAVPDYDRGRLMDEMALFPEWYLGRHLDVQLSDTDREALQASMAMLADDALRQPQVLVHRDYHCRNLMARADGTQLTGMLDFQDAVMGPVAYDAASLLKDCYIRWPHMDTARWRDVWAAGLIDAGLLASDAPVQRWIDWVGLQRHLKVLGIFARLFHRDGKARYLDDLPLVLDYVREVLGRYPAFEPLQRLFAHHVWPRL